MAKENNRKWTFISKGNYKIIVHAPTYKIAKKVLTEIKNEYIDNERK